MRSKFYPRIMALAGLALTLYALLSYAHGYWLQSQLSRRWQLELEEIKQTSRVDSGRSSGVEVKKRPQIGELVAELEIPRIGLKAAVLHGVGARQLKRAPGHIPGTALPGAKGNCVIAGHRDTFFRRLGELEVGDLVTVRTRSGLFRYFVSEKQVVEPDETSAIARTTEPRLTLVTCYPFFFIGPAPKRYIVAARLEPDEGG